MKVYWKQPDVMDDGVTPFTKEQFAGWTLTVDGKPAIAIPLSLAAWDGKPDTVYSYDLAQLALIDGEHTVSMQATEKDGDKSPASPIWKFTTKVVPSAPLVQSVA